MLHRRLMVRNGWRLDRPASAMSGGGPSRYGALPVLGCWRWWVWARSTSGLVPGPGSCAWTGLLRLDRASAVGPSEIAFQVVQRQPGGPTAARRSIRSQAVHPQPGGPTAARWSNGSQVVQPQPGGPTAARRSNRSQAVQPQPGGPTAARRSNRSQAVHPQPGGPTAARQSTCGGVSDRPSRSSSCTCRQSTCGGVGSGWCSCLGRRRTRGQRSRRPRPRARTSPAWPAGGPGLTVGRAGLRTRLGCGPGSSSKASQPIGQGGRVGDQRPWPARRIRTVGRQLRAKVSRIGTNTPPLPTHALRLVGIMRTWRAASSGEASLVPNLDTSPGPACPTNRTRSSYLPNSMVISTELGEHGSNRKSRTGRLTSRLQPCAPP